MALVILSARAISQGQTRTISMRIFVSLMLAAILMVLALGFGLAVALGVVRDLEPEYESRFEYGLAELVEIPAENSLDTVPADIALVAASPSLGLAWGGDADASNSRMLIDRLGELSGRMIRLESEARMLEERIAVISDFEARVAGSDEASMAKRRLARTPPGPSGGPWFSPQEELPRPVSESTIELDPSADLEVQLEQMDLGVSALAARLSDLDQIATTFKLSHLSFPGRSPIPEVSANSDFGNRLDPFSRRRAFHSGVDFNAPRGTPIHASAGGRVIFAGRRPQYGLTVEIEHMEGLVTRYAHASKIHVAVGDVVMPQALIAEVGSTGRSTGPHLHFEILKDGYFVNPSIYLSHF